MIGLERLNKAHELRRMAARYRYLATGIDDEATIAILNAMSREGDAQAERIEREVLLQKNRDHAA